MRFNLDTQFVALVAVMLTAVTAFGQYVGNGRCCDPTSVDFDPGQAQSCSVGGEPPETPSDGNVCDPDCETDYPTGTCPAIPIDGGLSLLALAGGGLATAAMRRRREEEAAQEVV